MPQIEMRDVMISESGDAIVECPYDSTHMICEQFLGKHLIKCRENHKLHKKVACKFDKTHLIPQPELAHHLSICPSRRLLDRELQLKAAAGAEGLHCGNVKGPEIISYDADDGEEEWGSVPASGAPVAPVALFNRKEKNFEESEYNSPRIIPGPNYVSRNTAETSREEPCRKFPMAPSKVAQIAEMSRKPTQPGSSSEVYLYSLSQAYSNPGFGRGRGIQRQAVQTPGVLRPHQPDPVVSASAVSGLVNMPQLSAVERYSHDYHQPRGLASEVNRSHFVSHLDISASLKKQQNGLYNQQQNETLAQGSRASVEEFENSKVKNNRPGTLMAAEQLMDFPKHQDQINVPTLPKGRGCLHGIEQLRRPATSAFTQGSSYSNLPDSHRMEGSSRDDGSNRLSQLDNMDDNESNFTEASSTMGLNDDLHRAVRKLRKKLKQLEALKQKSSAGIPLNEEEKNKLQKEDEIISLIESISKHL
ncbi:hypothetical protein BsWGS_14157 [Bradybaena similaris]